MMRYKIIFVELLMLSFILASCERKTMIPDRELIANIIVETIMQDSLDSNVFINSNLVNRYNYQQEFDNELGYIPPPPKNEKGVPFVFNFYKSNESNLLGFNQFDSIFVTEQIEKNKNITLEIKSSPNHYKFKNIPKSNNNGTKFYNFSVPLFNIKKDLVIVEYDYNCPGCGNGKIVFFRKIKSKWIKVKAFETWSN